MESRAAAHEIRALLSVLHQERQTSRELGSSLQEFFSLWPQVMTEVQMLKKTNDNLRQMVADTLREAEVGDCELSSLGPSQEHAVSSHVIRAVNEAEARASLDVERYRHLHRDPSPLDLLSAIANNGGEHPDVSDLISDRVRADLVDILNSNPDFDLDNALRLVPQYLAGDFGGARVPSMPPFDDSINTEFGSRQQMNQPFPAGIDFASGSVEPGMTHQRFTDGALRSHLQQQSPSLHHEIGEQVPGWPRDSNEEAMLHNAMHAAPGGHQIGRAAWLHNISRQQEVHPPWPDSFSHLAESQSANHGQYQQPGDWPHQMRTAGAPHFDDSMNFQHMPGSSTRHAHPPRSKGSKEFAQALVPGPLPPGPRPAGERAAFHSPAAPPCQEQRPSGSRAPSTNAAKVGGEGWAKASPKPRGKVEPPGPDCISPSALAASLANSAKAATLGKPAPAATGAAQGAGQQKARAFPRGHEPIAEHVVTLIVRNIPARCTQAKLLELWPAKSAYNVLYLPYCRRRRCTVGKAIINFVSHAAAMNFRAIWQGLALIPGAKAKPLDIGVAEVQGFEENLQDMMNNVKTNRVKNKQHMPAVLQEDGTRADFLTLAMSIQMHEPDAVQDRVAGEDIAACADVEEESNATEDEEDDYDLDVSALVADTSTAIEAMETEDLAEAIELAQIADIDGAVPLPGES